MESFAAITSPGRNCAECWGAKVAVSHPREGHRHVDDGSEELLVYGTGKRQEKIPARWKWRGKAELCLNSEERAIAVT